MIVDMKTLRQLFQSPQWGSNSKASTRLSQMRAPSKFQSPQWGSNSKDQAVG